MTNLPCSDRGNKVAGAFIPGNVASFYFHTPIAFINLYLPGTSYYTRMTQVCSPIRTGYGMSGQFATKRPLSDAL
jgi:hypothetical protein